MEQSFTLEAGSKAFGDGSHPTTKMVLAAIEAIDPAAFAPRVACDMGAGSGVLSLAIAAKFGCKVAAVDIERQAVETLRANALHNGLAVIPFPAGGGLGWGCSKAMPDPAAPLPASPLRGEGSSGVIIPVHSDGFRHPQIESLAPFDLIVMNILAEPLLSLAADAARNSTKAAY